MNFKKMWIFCRKLLKALTKCSNIIDVEGIPLQN
ncbi:hypothetical protein [Staphylococcus phage PT94]